MQLNSVFFRGRQIEELQRGCRRCDNDLMPRIALSIYMYIYIHTYVHIAIKVAIFHMLWRR